MSLEADKITKFKIFFFLNFRNYSDLHVGKKTVM